jgi:hypothetical protein
LIVITTPSLTLALFCAKHENLTINYFLILLSYVYTNICDIKMTIVWKLGLFTIYMEFRWFHTECKWNKHISTARPELFWNERFVWKGCPLLPIGTFQLVNVVPFTSFLFFHQFQALLDLTIGIIKWKAHNPNGIFYPKFCLPLAQFQTGWVFHVNGKQPWSPLRKFGPIVKLLLKPRS